MDKYVGAVTNDKVVCFWDSEYTFKPKAWYRTDEISSSRGAFTSIYYSTQTNTSRRAGAVE